MARAENIIKKYKNARTTLDSLFDSRRTTRLIHYSCESFFDNPTGASRRITSIAIRNFGSGQTKSFSIHEMAELKGVASQDLESKYDELEKLMLKEYYDYVRQNLNCHWMHWNMRDINFGFQAIAHRFRVLGGEPVDIPENNIIDLSPLLIHLYGEDYIADPRMQRLAEKHYTNMRGFLKGKEEAEAFSNGEYVKLHQSTLMKVEFLSSFAERAWDGTLKTNVTPIKKAVRPLMVLSEFFREYWVVNLVVALVGLIGSIISIASFIR